MGKLNIARPFLVCLVMQTEHTRYKTISTMLKKILPFQLLYAHQISAKFLMLFAVIGRKEDAKNIIL